MREKEKYGVVAFAFGVPETIRSNQRIAQIASQKAREFKAPVYTQIDVRIDVRVDTDIKVEYAEEKTGNPPPTLRIARGATQWAKWRRITYLWVVAAKPHLWRCMRDLKKAVIEEGLDIFVVACKEIDQYPEDEWFCQNSTQARVRSRKDWERREKILKVMPFFLYKLVAS